MIYRLGIGDILITKMVFDNHNLNHKFKIYKPFIQDYRENSEEYLNFIIQLSKKLFKQDTIEVVFSHESIFDNTKYKIEDLDLSKYFKIKKEIDEDYLVFHTKIRLDGESKAFLSEQKQAFNSFLKNFKTSKKIVLLGEREIPDKFNQNVIYKDLLVLKDNNDIIDLTEEKMITSPKWELFERDVSIIHNADLNIGIGYGGNMVISSAFSDKNCFYIGNLKHNYFNSCRNSVFSDLGKFFNKINKEQTNG